jgi:hypothetical protein
MPIELAQIRARHARIWASSVVLVAVVLVGGCAKTPTPGLPTTTTVAPLPFEGSPSRAALAEVAGLVVPSSATTYRSTRIDNSELHVTFTLPVAEVERFVTDSDLPPLTEGRRLIIHPSPLWDQNPEGPVASTSSTARGVVRTVEVLGDGDPRTVRLTVTSR